MWISRLNLTSFRNYQHLDLSLTPHLTVIHGDNAQGKTNFMEAIHMLSAAKSYRASSDRELVNHSDTRDDFTVTRLSAEVQRAMDNIKVDIALMVEGVGPATGKIDALPAESPPLSVRKRIRVNGIARRAIDLVGKVNVVMFSAQDIDLLSGAPVLCRRYLDLVNSQIDPRYLRSLQRYNKVLLQRNHLLRMLQEHKAQPEQLEFWDKELVESGSYLIRQRQNLVTALNELAENVHRELSGGREKLKIVYLPSVSKEEDPADIESCFYRALHQTRGREVGQGITVVGPHRDNLQFQVNGADMSKYGSRGQQRTVVLSLRLAEAEHMHTRIGDSPVLLLDDVLSEFDEAHRTHLLEFILSFQQVMITTTDIDRFEPSFLAQAVRFRVKQGNIEAV